jgi:hypothetical protein
MFGLARTVIISISRVGEGQLERLGGRSRLLGGIWVIIGGLIGVMMTGIIIWVLVVLAGHDGVWKKGDGEVLSSGTEAGPL